MAIELATYYRSTGRRNGIWRDQALAYVRLLARPVVQVNVSRTNLIA